MIIFIKIINRMILSGVKERWPKTISIFLVTSREGVSGLVIVQLFLPGPFYSSNYPVPFFTYYYLCCSDNQMSIFCSTERPIRSPAWIPSKLG